jgi:hypothetical protein
MSLWGGFFALYKGAIRVKERSFLLGTALKKA